MATTSPPQPQDPTAAKPAVETGLLSQFVPALSGLLPMLARVAPKLAAKGVPIWLVSVDDPDGYSAAKGVLESPVAAPTVKTAPSTLAQLFDEVHGFVGYRLGIDLPRQVVIKADGSEIPFEVQAFRKYCLLGGFDDIGLTLRHADKIRAFEAERLLTKPWLAHTI